MPAKKKSGNKKKKEVVKETIIREYKDDLKSKKTKVKKSPSVSKKATRKKRTPVKKPSLSENDLHLEKRLIENFVGLQKVMVNLSVKFDDLTGKISKLLDLFEISAKSLAEKDLTVEKTSRNDEKIIHAVDELSEQNKIIAKGLLLMNNKLDEEPGEHGMRPIPQHHLPGNLEHQRISPQQKPSGSPSPGRSMEEYQKSIFSPSNQQSFKKLPGK